MDSGQFRDFGADASAAWQARTYASRGFSGGAVSGVPRAPGYSDPQAGALMYPGAGVLGGHNTSSPESEHGVHDTDEGMDTGFNNGGPGDTQAL